MEEKKLIEKILNKDYKAFNILVDRYYPEVLKISNGFLHNKIDAEDMTQDVFIEIYQSLAKFRKESSLATWIYRITVNKSLNLIRKHKREKLVENFESFIFSKKSEDPNSYKKFVLNEETEIEREERSAKLYKAIEKLPNNQKIAFTLSKYDDMSYKEIAEVMGVSLSSVESLIHRAKMNLQKYLINYYENSKD